MKRIVILVAALAVAAQVLPAQPIPTPSWPDLAKAHNPMLISLMVHVEEGKTLSQERYRQVAAGLRSLAQTFHKHNARINLDVEPGFIKAMFEADDPLLKELEQRYQVAIGGFPHGAPSRETIELVRKSGAKPVYIFGNWGRTNKDWVGDAIGNGIDVMLGFFAVLAPEVPSRSVFDHETIPWNRAERVHPWRVATTENCLRHDPAGKVIYIPGDSIDELEKLYDRYLTGLWNRPLDHIYPKPTLDEKDFAVASEYLRRQLHFADPARINTWYIAVNSKKVRDFTAAAPLFDQWLASVDQEFVRPGLALWANAGEVRRKYLEWEKRGKKPPLYLTIVVHNEERLPGYQNKDFYLRNRQMLCRLAITVHDHGAMMDLQSDWNFLKAVAQYDTKEVMANTGGKNILKWIVEDLGLAADPHAHESKYNYADVAYLHTQLGVEPSATVGGFLFSPPDNPQGWEQHEKGIHGRVYPSYFWRADQLWGAATAGHRGDDEHMHGVWKPTDREHFFDHDPSRRLVYIGGNCYSWMARPVPNASAIHKVVEAISSGDVPRDGFYTANIFIAQARLTDRVLTRITADLDSLQPLVRQGRIVWSSLTETANHWRTDYHGKPFQCPCVGIAPRARRPAAK